MEQAIADSDVSLVVIGPDWLRLEDAEGIDVWMIRMITSDPRYVPLSSPLTRLCRCS